MNEQKEKKRVVPPPLPAIAEQLARVDHHLLRVLKKRQKLAILVERRKEFEGNAPIIRKEIETKRIAQFKALAKEEGIDPDFAHALLYSIISESCRTQLCLRQEAAQKEKRETGKEEWHQGLKKALLELAAAIAPSYDQEYGANAPFATRLCMAFEERAIKQAMESRNVRLDSGLAIDLGCATGRTALMMSPHFEKVIGYDISSEMVAQAKAKLATGEITNAEFAVQDIEEGIPLPDSSVSLAVMNLGTASDIRNLKRVLFAIKRVLRPNGAFALSFYNAGALFYHWPIPWPISLKAEVDLVDHCLDVRYGQRTYQIYARAYTTREISILLKDAGLKVSTLMTFPAMASILPNGFFGEGSGEKAFEKIVEEVDEKLTGADHGAYILATGEKT